MSIDAPVYHDPLPPLQMLLSQECWGIAAGAGTGATISLHFGRKLPRLRALENPNLSPELRTHQGEAILFVECKWCVRSKRKTLFDSSGNEGKMIPTLSRLLGVKVARISLTMPFETLSIEFDNGDSLDLEAELPDAEDPHDNFTFSFADTSFVVGSDRALRLEQRKGISWDPMIVPTWPSRTTPRGRTELQR